MHREPCRYADLLGGGSPQEVCVHPPSDRRRRVTQDHLNHKRLPFFSLALVVACDGLPSWGGEAVAGHVLEEAWGLVRFQMVSSSSLTRSGMASMRPSAGFPWISSRRRAADSAAGRVRRCRFAHVGKSWSASRGELPDGVCEQVGVFVGGEVAAGV